MNENTTADGKEREIQTHVDKMDILDLDFENFEKEEKKRQNGHFELGL